MKSLVNRTKSEIRAGRWRWIAIYLASGSAGAFISLISWVWDPWQCVKFLLRSTNDQVSNLCVAVCFCYAPASVCACLAPYLCASVCVYIMCVCGCKPGGLVCVYRGVNKSEAWELVRGYDTATVINHWCIPALGLTAWMKATRTWPRVILPPNRFLHLPRASRGEALWNRSHTQFNRTKNQISTAWLVLWFQTGVWGTSGAAGEILEDTQRNEQSKGLKPASIINYSLLLLMTDYSVQTENKSLICELEGSIVFPATHNKEVLTSEENGSQ